MMSKNTGTFRNKKEISCDDVDAHLIEVQRNTDILLSQFETNRKSHLFNTKTLVVGTLSFALIFGGLALNVRLKEMSLPINREFIFIQRHGC